VAVGASGAPASSSRRFTRARFSREFQSCAYAFFRTTPSAPMTKFSGTPVVAYTRWMSPGGSCSTSNVRPNSLTKSRTFCVLAASSMLTATTSKPRGAKSRCSASRLGISSRHGGHHVAHTLRSTTLPR
jgi:hypothetical protein